MKRPYKKPKKIESGQQVLIKSNALYQELFYVSSDEEKENCELNATEMTTFGVTVKKRDNGSNYEDQSFLIVDNEKDFYINDVFSGGQEILDIETKP